jgi:protein-tyrosine-phosphatase
VTTGAYHVLFLCTGNSARSILAEAILNQRGASRYRGFSAGSQPKDAPHPLALDTLAKHGHPTSGLRSKSWDEFAKADSPEIDLVITVCDNAAAESCPVWPGGPVSAHWSHIDPAAFRGPEDEARRRFETVYQELDEKIRSLIDLDPRNVPPPELSRALARIASIRRGDRG